MGSILIRVGISVAGKLIVEGIKWLARRDDNDLTVDRAKAFEGLCNTVLRESKGRNHRHQE